MLFLRRFTESIGGGICRLISFDIFFPVFAYVKLEVAHAVVFINLLCPHFHLVELVDLFKVEYNDDLLVLHAPLAVDISAASPVNTSICQFLQIRIQVNSDHVLICIVGVIIDDASDLCCIAGSCVVEINWQLPFHRNAIYRELSAYQVAACWNKVSLAILAIPSCLHSFAATA